MLDAPPTSKHLPKYRRIVQEVIGQIQDDSLQKGDTLPSINQVCEEQSVSRDTVLKAYDVLEERGVIEPVHGKGFYVRVNEYRDTVQTFVLFDQMSDYKEIVYQGMQDTTGSDAELDLFFHHRDRDEFRRLIEEAAGSYQYYIVMPPTNPGEAVYDALRTLNEQRVLVMDVPLDPDRFHGAYICQNFREQFRDALEQGRPSIESYEQFTLVFPADDRHPVEIKDTFRAFCADHDISGSVVPSLRDHQIQTNQAYLVIEDQDLVRFVKHVTSQGLVPGRDIGLMSYNDTPFKEIIEDGITVISTDFRAMGKLAGQQVLDQSHCQMTVLTRLIQRRSL